MLVASRRHGTRRGHWTAQAEQLLDLLNALGSTIFRQFLWQRAAELDLTYAQGQVLFHVVAHTAAGMGGHVEENLALRVGEVQLGRRSPTSSTAWSRRASSRAPATRAIAAPTCSR